MTKPAPKYFLVTDATAEEVERQTGLIGRPTPYGVLVAASPDMTLVYEALAELRGRLEPMHCTCMGVIHLPGCPMACIS
jgi:hypothetical protein